MPPVSAMTPSCLMLSVPMLAPAASATDTPRAAKPHYFLRGNHDERLWELAAKRKGPCSDYAFSGVVEVTTLTEKMRCKMLPYHHRDGILKIGHMKMLQMESGAPITEQAHTPTPTDAALIFNSRDNFGLQTRRGIIFI